MRDLVDRLPRRRRDAILLYYYADLPVGAISRQMRVPEGTVRRLLTEARADLARDLRERP
jgi:RNA polymerase sigma-70 factor (ECF subfamily)